MKNEVWIVINDYPLYSISNLGNVKNNKTNLKLKIDHNKDGYCQVKLYNPKLLGLTYDPKNKDWVHEYEDGIVRTIINS